MSSNPNDPNGLFLKGRVQYVLGLYQESLDLVQKAEEMGYSDPDLYLMKSLFLSMSGNYKESLKLIDHAMSLGLRGTNIYNHKGKILFDLGEYDRALKCYEKAAQLNSASESHISYNNMAICLAKCGRYEESLIALQEALTINKDSINLHYRTSLSLFALGRYDEALSYYDKLSFRESDEGKIVEQLKANDVFKEILENAETIELEDDWSISATEELELSESTEILTPDKEISPEITLVDISFPESITHQPLQRPSKIKIIDDTITKTKEKIYSLILCYFSTDDEFEKQSTSISFTSVPDSK